MKRPSRRSTGQPTTASPKVAADPAAHGPNRIEAGAGRGPCCASPCSSTSPHLHPDRQRRGRPFLGEWADAGVIFGVVMVSRPDRFHPGRPRRRRPGGPRPQRGQRRHRCCAAAGWRIDVVTLVPGDVVRLVPATRCRPTCACSTPARCSSPRPALTGESVGRQDTGVSAPTAGWPARQPGLAGTLVVGGQGGGLVVATGAPPRPAASPTCSTPPIPRHPLTRAMARFFHLPAGWLIWAWRLRFRGRQDARRAARRHADGRRVALAVGAIPRACRRRHHRHPGHRRGAHGPRRAIIRRLPAVETLAAPR